MTDWFDRLRWDQLQLPTPHLGHLPLPHLPGGPALWVLLLPAIAAVLGTTWMARSSRLAAWTAVGFSLLTWLAASWQLLLLVQDPAATASTPFGSLPLGELSVPLGLRVDWPMGLVAWTVASVATVVQVYARWYLWYDPRYRVFAATVSLFTAAMLLTVLADDLVLVLAGWEVMGWCSYLLIGHHSTKAAARRAATKAMLVTRTADIAFVLALTALAAGAGTTGVPGVVAHWSATGGSPTLTAIMLLLVVGVAGKSALFPFQDWLPDAMEGPTPASALIHAATMVAAGTVVLVHLFDLLTLSGPARMLLAVLASVTMLGAALTAFAQADLKRLLAWSTVSQVALMLGAVAASTRATGTDGAVQQLIGHAWTKALLFLVVGWLAVVAGGTAITRLAASVSRYRVLRRRIGLGLLALAGVPPLTGFVTKELVLSTAESAAGGSGGVASFVVLAAVVAAVPLTVAYCVRAWLVLSAPTPEQSEAREWVRPVQRIDDFFAEPEVVQEAEGVERAEAAISSSARFGTTLLLVLSVLGGVLVLLPWWNLDLHLDLTLLAATLLLMVVAALVVRLAALGVRTRDAAARVPARLALAAERGHGFDYLYRLLVAAPVMVLARAVVRYDSTVLDAWVRGAGAGSRLLGTAGDRLVLRRATPALALVLVAALLLAGLGVVLR